MSKKAIPTKSDDISEWYIAVIQGADLADYGPSKGSMIIKPYGYAIWELAQQELDNEIKKKGVSNAYFPLLIPISFIDKEKNHLEGFSPELAIVTKAGGEDLEEPLVIRPTSETIMYHSYAKWIHSWRDLPVMMNQWNNVVRWEKRTLPFMRTSEFLWQEGHTAHATHKEAIDMQKWAIEMYAAVYRNLYAIDGYVGSKSKSERFAGAYDTLTYECLMPSGKVLQACTSHDLAQNFSTSFNIAFQNKQGEMKNVWQTSWGFSTRSIGALIMAHGDDNGLCLPPRLAPTQLVIVPAKLTPEVIEYCEKLLEETRSAGVRALVDVRDDESFGFKLNKWEVKGAPLVAKVGPKEVENAEITLKRRDTLSEEVLPRDGIDTAVLNLLETIQNDMLASSRQLRDDNTRTANNYDEFKQIQTNHKGFIRVNWNENPDTEKKIKDDTKATSRCLISADTKGVDFITGEPSNTVWLFAQSY